mmetsp:Transcript_140658/g.248384  ORF Transcript_140658/g.248384 Transcript_140658/m.248384 type:complete len:237 (-) Transcript_140658:1531-2241(-)
MNKVKGNILLSSAATGNELLKCGKQRLWRGFSLYQPAVVEAHLALCEGYDLPLLVIQSCVRRERLWIMNQNVIESLVMILNDTSFGVAFEHMALCHCWKKCLVLENVMDCCQCQHSLTTLLADAHITCQAARFHKDFCEAFPRKSMVQICSLLLLVHLEKDQILARLAGHHGGVFHIELHGFRIMAEAKAQLAIHVYAHQPVDGIEGTYRSLILLLSCVQRCGANALCTSVFVTYI